ncbi:MAG: hypothetical protein AAFQ36_02615 [Pseudomonadota bacterium]
MRQTLATLLTVSLYLPSALFWGGTLWLGIWGEPLAFQRWGSVGVAMSIVGFGLARALTRYARTREDRREAIEEISSGKVLLALVGTLQWGYGDLVHAWAHGLATFLDG